MIKNKRMVFRGIVTIIGVLTIIASSLIGIPQFMTNEKYVDKVEYQPKAEEKLPQKDDFNPIENN